MWVYIQVHTHSGYYLVAYGDKQINYGMTRTVRLVNLIENQVYQVVSLVGYFEINSNPCLLSKCRDRRLWVLMTASPTTLVISITSRSP